MKPLQRFKAICDLLSWYTRCCGVDFFTGQYGLVTTTFRYLSVCVAAFLFLLYTICVAPTDVVMQAIMFVFLGSQGFVKFGCMAYNLRCLHEYVKYLQKVYAENQDPTTEGYQVIDRWSSRFYTITKFISKFINATGIIFALVPVAYFAIYRETVLMLPMWMPFVDHTEPIGYLVTSTFHILILMATAFGLIGNDVFMFILILHIIPLTEIFQVHTNKVNLAVKKREENAKTREMHQYIRNLIEIHKDMCRYTRSISCKYSIGFFTETNTDGAVMILGLYVAMVSKWIPIYPFFVLILLKLLAICFLGSLVETMADLTFESIANIQFYMLPIEIQKDIGFMTRCALQPTILKSGTAMINLNMFVSILKTVYSVGMLLLESVE